MIKLNKSILTLNNVEGDPNRTYLIASFNKYAAEVDYFMNKVDSIIAFEVPLINLGNNFYRSIEQFVATSLDGNYFNGYSTDPLVAAQDRQWVIIKAKRAELIASIDMDLSANEINNQIAAIKTIAQDLKTQIYAATEIEDVLPITWPS